MQHPDEGTIHAWLDGALPPDEAAVLEAHVAGCAACAAAVAEARGLLAASSRILAALDAVPGGVLPAGMPEASGIAAMKAGRAHQRRWLSTPWRAAAAIVVVGSVGWLAAHSRVPVGDEAKVAATGEVAAAAAAPPAAAPAAAQAAAPAAPARSGAAARVLAQSKSRSDPARSQGAGVPNVLPGENRMEGTAAAQARTVDATIVAKVPGQGSASGYIAADQAQGEKRAQAAVALRGRGASLEAKALEEQVATSSQPIQATPQTPPASAGLARLMPEADALRRFVGCYALERSGGTGEAVRDEALAVQLPMRVELLADRSAQLVRGAPPFRPGTRGVWGVTNGDGLLIRIGEGTKWLTVRLTVVGDSVSGTLAEGREGVKGTRYICRR